MGRLTWIDYSPQYFVGLMGQALPERRAGKFVQLLEDDADEYLVMSPRQLSTYHANIVERFFLKLDVSGEWNVKRDSFRLFDDHWSILGGGHFQIDDAARTLRLFSKSLAYGRFDPDGLAEGLATVEALNGYVIHIE